ncbi:glycoside hydrolase family 9 protein [Microbacterium sp. cx-55]|uniref:glycoside hydrolase family 9 protein n=1 Tax=Microbacterium sp. cx-55 TaxID=2875948 RepID=UPI001CBF066C|nr:glycoside hydrolase family 9 protein [Microbacterium sp. cx-55]MBZ4487492.1 glycoside hydrolase family 9 protein [Microbacterium sp. cx-55]UGB35512.1 glycoside hydrolase family 9 protein [Microbacterium sp. cx-55]
MARRRVTSIWRGAAIATAVAVGGAVIAAPPAAAATVERVAISQAGYDASGHKVGSVITDGALPGSTTCRILQGSTVVVPSCTLLDRGTVWGDRVYVVDFTTLTAVGDDYALEVSGVLSPRFSVTENVWAGYLDEMTAFYRLQRSGVATADAYPAGYSSIAPSEKIFHGPGHLDDAASADGTIHYDLTGGWYDAGDYGIYGGNQWVGGNIAITYLRYGDTAEVAFDNDDNGVPDLVDEARFGSEYLLRMRDAFDGAFWDIKGSGGFQHPDAHTDGIVGTADDRRISGYGVGGSAKAAGSLAATARAIEKAIADGKVPTADVAEWQTFAAEAEEGAVAFYQYADSHRSDPIGGYSTTRGGIANSLLFAEVQLHLLTGDTAYRASAETTIAATEYSILSSTNYWDMGPLSMAELYPAATATGKTAIQRYLKKQLDYFLSTTDDTPYGVVNQFKNFGVNEPHIGYVADAMRYYELFGDQRALKAVQRGLYWVFGNNPWGTSWVSGVGENSVKYLHTRLDEEAQSQSGTGVVLPGALVSGPNAKDPLDVRSASPWYADRPVWQDSGQQWRYNEYSVSIQSGLFSTLFGMTAIGDAAWSAGTPPTALNVTSPQIGDAVTGDVTVFAQSGSSLTQHALGPNWTPMTAAGGVSTGTVNVDALAPFTTTRVDVRGTQASGANSYSSTHYTVAPPLPNPESPLLYDGFGRDGVFGMQGYTWVNWYNNHAGVGTASNTTVDGRTAARLFQNPASAMSQAKFQPWHHSMDAAGYRYLTVTMRSPSPNLRLRIEVSDADSNHRVTGTTPIPIATGWTTYSFDLDAFPGLDPSQAKLVFWLQQTADTDGELFVDEVSFTNQPSGTAPTLSGVSHTSGTLTTGTDVTVQATYTDPDGEAPHAVELVLDGVIHRMSAVDPADTDVTDGAVYAVTRRWVKGVHSYDVRTTDTTSGVVTTPLVTGVVVG